MLSFLFPVLGAGLLAVATFQPVQALASAPGTELRQEPRPRQHTVKPKENFYSVARLYKVPVQQLKKANPGVTELKIGQTIIIPAAAVTASASKKPAAAAAAPKKATPAPVAKATPMPASAKTFSVDANGKKWHTVAPGQTLFSLSGLFNIPVEELQRLNNLKTTDVRAGQVLLVGKQPAPAKPNVGQYVPEKDDELEASTKPAEPVKVIPVIAAAEPVNKPEPEETVAAPAETANRFQESGLAAVINERFRSSKLLALHRTAPVGTLLQVKNSMNGKTVYVRVIGQLPDTGENDKVIVKISKKAYNKLGALDARFLAEVSYMQ